MLTDDSPERELDLLGLNTGEVLPVATSVSQNFETISHTVELVNGLCHQVRHFRRIYLSMTQHVTNISYFRELILFNMASTTFTSFRANIEC